MGKHKVYGCVVAIEMAAAFVDDSALIRQRLQNGPPKITPTGSKPPPQLTQWKLGACGGCGEEIRGGSVVEHAGKKYHKDCFKCETCSASLVGAKYKCEAGQLLCWPCYIEAFASTCAGCGEKIDGPVMKCQGKTWHKGCFKPAPPAEP